MQSYIQYMSLKENQMEEERVFEFNSFKDALEAIDLNRAITHK